MNVKIKRVYESPSSLQLFKKCPHAYYLRYFTKQERAGTSEAANFGKYLHKVMEEIYNFVIDARFVGYMDPKFVRATARRVGEELGMDFVKIEEATALVNEYLKRQGTINHEQHIANEKEHEITIEGIGLVRVVIDRIDRKDEDTALVIDYKSGKDWNDYHFQITLYLYAVKQLFDWAMNSVFRIDFLKLKTSKEFDITPGQLAKRIDEIKFIKERIDAGGFNPIIGQHCRFCDFRKVCEFVKKKG